MAADQCCALGICCARPRQQKTLGQMIAEDLGNGALTPDQIAGWILDHFDLWHKGSLELIKDDVAGLMGRART